MEHTSGTLEAWVLVALDILKVVVIELFVWLVVRL